MILPGFPRPMMTMEPTIIEIPHMTSNTTPAGFIVTSNGVGAQVAVAYYVFNGDYNDAWSANSNSPAILPTWVQLELPAPAKVIGYKLTHGAFGSARAPKDWKLQASNGGALVDVDTRTNQTGWGSGIESRTFTVASPGYYTHYRFYLTANNGATDYAVITELELLQVMP